MTTRATTVADLDLGVAERQAFGGTFGRPKNGESQVARYRAGALRLPPHKDWKGNFTDWAADPYKDRNWQFQHHTLRWVNAIRWAAMDGDDAARSEWVRVAQSWFAANVPAEKAVGAFAWKDMADGNRAVELSLGAPLVPAEASWFVELLGAHRDWLMDDTHIVGGNHGLHQNTGLLVVGAVLRDHAAMQKSLGRLVRSFERAFDEQGCNEEGSVAYHQMNIRWWRQTWARVDAEGLEVPTHVTARLDAACTVLAHLAQPDGELPQIGDSARSKVVPGLSEVTDFVISAGKRGETPGARALVLERGYAISRSGWGEDRPAAQESHLVVRHGAYARAHGHFDSGSVHLYTAGRRWLVDPGFHSYQTGDPTRRYLASREAHNVPLLPELDREPKADFELVRSSSTDAADDLLLVDRGYDGADLERRVVYLRDADCWIVWDRASRRDEQELTLEQHWQTDVGVTVRPRDQGFRLNDTTSTTTMTMTWLGTQHTLARHDAARGEDLTGYVGTRWKTLEPATRLTARATGTAPQLVTLIGAHSPRPLGLVDSFVMQGGSLILSPVRGDSWWSVNIGQESVRVHRHHQS
ncbi:heparinase II/III domain-containing protein [Brachybacterium sp. AOP42-C2-15]|uniref:heparinase II/III domain-containing protein n=1 Tax=Brachybacterium sp. AOP42-C2-15 TaxID=3457670 RepID=UPI0040335A03